jgi:hypothetical protein
VGLRKKLARTGITVRDRRSEPRRAKTTVAAMGWNILPSMPVRARIGK